MAINEVIILSFAVSFQLVYLIYLNHTIDRSQGPWSTSRKWQIAVAGDSKDPVEYTYI